jgi:hypothetical protein
MAQLDDIADALRNAHAAGDTASAQKLADAYVAAQGRAQPAAKPESERFAAGRAGVEFLNRAHIGPVGAGDVVTAAATGLNSAALGIPERLTGDTLAGMRAAAPTAATIGDIGGTVAGGAGIAKTLTNVAPRLALRTGEGIVKQGAKLAATGAAAGALQAEATGQDLPTAAAEGGVGGAVAGGVADVGGKALLMLRNRGIHALGKMIGEDPADIAQAMVNLEQKLGRKVTMMDVANLRARGSLKQFASRNPEFGADVAAEQAGREAQLPKSQSGNADQPTDLVTLHAQRDAKMNTAMGDQTDPAALRNQPITSGTASSKTSSVLDNPAIVKAMRGDSELQTLVSEALTEPTHQPLTVDNFENLRQTLRKAQNSEPNSIRSAKIKSIADEVEKYAGERQPAYRAALDSYRSDSNYADAFAHGRQGGSRTNIDDPKLRAALKSPEGLKGYDVGAAEKTAADNLSSTAPSFIKPEQGMGSSEAAHLAIAAAKSGSPWGMYHLMRAVPGLKVPPAAQKRMVQMLTNAREAPQALKLMAKYGAQKADIDKLSQALSAAGGLATQRAMGE